MQALLALAAILQPMAPAGSEDWWLVSYGGARPERLVVFVDKNSVTRDGRLARAWEADYQEVAGQTSTDIYTKAQFEYDCAAKTFRTIALVEQQANGVTLNKAVGADLAKPAPVISGTMGDTEMRFACGQSVGATQIGGGLDVAKVGRAILNGLDQAVASK